MSADDQALLHDALEPVPLSVRGRLQSQNRRIEYIYFIEVGVASVVAIGGAGRRRAEVAMVGREGMTGLPVVNGLDLSPWEIFMQVEGAGKRIEASALRQVLTGSPTLRGCLLRYAHAFTVQSSYTALANAHGNLKERLARWLLMSQDRVGQNELLTTHETLSHLMGVRRAGVTSALQEFKRNGLIAHRRGLITILDRPGLKAQAGGFYGVAEAEFDWLLGS